MKEKTTLYCCIAWFIVSLILAIIAAVCFVLFPYAVEYKIKKEIAIVPGSTQTSNWITPPVPLYASFTFFNVNNPDEVTKEGKKANLTLVGPFYYKYYRNKFNVTWDDDESRVSYHLDTYYVFDEKKSNGMNPKDFTVTTLNVPFLGLLLKLETLSNNILERLGRDVLDEFLRLVERKDTLFYKVNVHDLLWGYHDKTLQLLKDFRLTDNATFSVEQNHSTNDSHGWSTVRTGKYDSKLVGQYTQWNNLREIAPWNSTAARKLDGTGGYLFHSNVKRHDVLRVYVSELYRSGDFTCDFDTEVYDIKLHHFVVSPAEFQNASTYPPNYGYSAFGKPGVLNLTAVFPQNLPIFASKPHFLDADKSYLDGVIGLHPNRSLHEAFLDVEPNTGAVLKAAKRLQFNVLLERDGDIEQLKGLRDSTMFPWFIATEESTITESKADELKSELLTPIKDVRIGLIAALSLFGAISLIMLVGVVYACVRYHKRKREDGVGSINSRTPLLSATLLNQSENSS